LSTGVLDAAANTLDSFVSNKLNETCKYFINNNGMYLVCPMVFSEVTWNKLSSEDQQIISECWKKASTWYVEQSEGLIEKHVAAMEAAGVTFCDIEDLENKPPAERVTWKGSLMPRAKKYNLFHNKGK